MDNNETNCAGDLAASIDHENNIPMAGFSSPLASRATRSIARRSKASLRGATVVKLAADNCERVVQFESKLEQRVLWLMLASNSVYDVWEQPPSLIYFDDEGNSRIHTPDFLVTLVSGRRIAIAVKPAKLAHKRDFVRDLKCVRKALRKDYADDLLFVTDQDFTPAQAMNAQRVIGFRRYVSERDLAPLREVLNGIRVPMTVKELAVKLDKGGAGYRTIFVAIYNGLLSADRTKLIDMDTAVLRGETL